MFDFHTRIIIALSVVIVLFLCFQVWAEANFMQTISDIEQLLSNPREFAIMSDAEREAIAEAIVLHARSMDIDPYLVLGVVKAESSGRWYAENKGCLGLMQVNFHVWDDVLREKGIVELKDDYFNISNGIRAGCYILRQYLNRYSGDINKALLKYSGYPKKRSQRYLSKAKSFLGK